MPVNAQLRIFLNELQTNLSLANTSHSREEKEPPTERLSLTRAKMTFEFLEVGPLPCENWAGGRHPFECDFQLELCRRGRTKQGYIGKSGQSGREYKGSFIQAHFGGCGENRW